MANLLSIERDNENSLQKRGLNMKENSAVLFSSEK